MTQYRFIVFTLILILLVLLAAFFSLAETALMAVNRYRLRHQARLKKNYAIRLLQLLKRPDRLLGAILIGNNFANMLASSLATLLGFYIWGDRGAILAATFLTFIVLIFGEVTPKTFAAIYPDQVAKIVVYPIQIFLKLLYPLVWLVNGFSNALLALINVRITHHAAEPLSREELRSVVYDTRGKISKPFHNMLLGILDLNKLSVDDLMVPRHEIVGLNIEEPWEKIVDQIYTIYRDWVPVYRHDIDQVVGILFMRDILRLVLVEPKLNKQLLLQFLQEPYFVPQGTSLSNQLKYFQSHDKIAFVVDEYGEIQGLITLNDILEEIAGDFTANLVNKKIQAQEDGSYLVDGVITVRDFNRTSDWELPLGGARTINGMIIESLESLPHVGTCVLIANYPIEILQVKENRVRLARIFPKLNREKSIE